MRKRVRKIDIGRKRRKTGSKRTRKGERSRKIGGEGKKEYEKERIF